MVIIFNIRKQKPESWENLLEQVDYPKPEEEYKNRQCSLFYTTTTKNRFT